MATTTETRTVATETRIERGASLARGPALILGTILLGIVGAIFGGAMFQQLGYAGVTGVNLPSILIAAIGAVLVLVVFHAIRGQRTTA